MNADFRVKKLVTEEGGDVVAICYDVLYGETFEKYIGIPDDFDGKENASNLLKDSNYEISDEIRADIEDIFGVKEFDDEQDYDGYQFYDFGDDEDEDIYVNIETKEEYTMSPTNDGRIRLYSLSDDSGRSDITVSEDEFYKNYEYVESEEKIDDLVYAGNANGVSTNESFNLREALNKIDLDTDNTYDLLNLYEACDLSENEKRALANIVYDQNDPSVIYDTLNDRFLGKEIEMPERVKDGVIHEGRMTDRYKAQVKKEFENEIDSTDISHKIADDGLSFEIVRANGVKLFFTPSEGYTTTEPKNESKSIKEDVGAKTFSQWFDETQHHGDDDEFYPFSNYIKKFPNAEVLKDATAEDIKNNAHRFYDIYDVDSVDRENAFNFASEELGIDYDAFYHAWMNDQPMKGVNESVDEFEFDDEFNAYYDGYTEEDKDENSSFNKLKNNVNESLSSRLVDFIKDYDFYHYSDTLEVGDTEEDAIKEMDRELSNPKTAKSLLDSLVQISKEDSLDGEQKEIVNSLIVDVKKLLNKNEPKSIKESDEETPYTKEEVERDLKSITHNFTDKDGELKCGFEEEKNFGVEILKQHYKVVEASGDDRRDGTWYHISFAEPLNKNESVDPSLLGDCPECGDKSFDTKKGKCTKCSYREELNKSKSIKESCDAYYKYPDDGTRVEVFIKEDENGNFYWEDAEGRSDDTFNTREQALTDCEQFIQSEIDGAVFKRCN